MAKLLRIGETDSSFLFPKGQPITKDTICRLFKEPNIKKPVHIFLNNEVYRTLVLEQGNFVPEKEGEYYVVFDDPTDDSSIADYIDRLKGMEQKTVKKEETAAGPSANVNLPRFGQAFEEEKEETKTEEEEPVEYLSKKLQFMVYFPRTVSAVLYDSSDGTNELIPLANLKGRMIHYESLILTSMNRFDNEVDLLVQAVRETLFFETPRGEIRRQYNDLCLENFNSYQVSRLVLWLKPWKLKVALANTKEKLGLEVFEIARMNLELVCNRDSSFEQFQDYRTLHRNISLDFVSDRELWMRWIVTVVENWYELEDNLKLNEQLTMSTRTVQGVFDLLPAVKDKKHCLNFTEALKSLPFEFNLQGKEFYLIRKEKKAEERLLIIRTVEEKRDSISIRGADFWLNFLYGIQVGLEVPAEEREARLQIMGNTRRVCDIYDKF